MPALTGNDPKNSLSPAEMDALQRGVAKIVELGAQVGVGPEQMIELLKAGLTVRQLLEYLESHAGEVT